jgi:hypothetical protein
MENCVGSFGASIQELHGLFRWEDEQFNFASLICAVDKPHLTGSSLTVLLRKVVDRTGFTVPSTTFTMLQRPLFRNCMTFFRVRASSALRERLVRVLLVFNKRT